MNDFLKALSVGDEVLVETKELWRSEDYKPVKSTISRATDHTLWVGESRFRRSSGFGIGKDLDKFLSSTKETPISADEKAVEQEVEADINLDDAKWRASLKRGDDVVIAALSPAHGAFRNAYSVVVKVTRATDKSVWIKCPRLKVATRFSKETGVEQETSAHRRVIEKPTPEILEQIEAGKLRESIQRAIISRQVLDVLPVQALRAIAKITNKALKERGMRTQ